MDLGQMSLGQMVLGQMGLGQMYPTDNKQPTRAERIKQRNIL